MNDQEEKLRELERRIAVLENYSRPSNPGKKLIWAMLGIILALFLVMFAIGVIQFVSNG
ncbi:hypothetical protein [Paenibacillus sp. S150]|uniref:hypothetical protein n=1 Tax=Paenibacillus sp. S150 TaxID=2749826 RepID=UPI001C573A9F|nr:hypothetical protein [Paenibacillus sp. S150]MBW4080043.1 hypothetical protein [Paenibacillus sp. S150]